MPASNKATLTELSGRYQGGGEAAIRQCYPGITGFLVFPPKGKSNPLVWTPEMLLESGKTSQLDTENETLCFYAADGSVVVPIEKKGRNSFSAVTIGRDETNDIRLKTGIVSKFHTFIWEDKDSYTIEDKCSTNGTFINGIRLPPGEKYQLPLGSELGISEIQCLLVDFDCLFELIRIVSK